MVLFLPYNVREYRALRGRTLAKATDHAMVASYGLTDASLIFEMTGGVVSGVDPVVNECPQEFAEFPATSVA